MNKLENLIPITVAIIIELDQRVCTVVDNKVKYYHYLRLFNNIIINCCKRCTMKLEIQNPH